jgi:ankyrin repeat protein
LRQVAFKYYKAKKYKKALYYFKKINGIDKNNERAIYNSACMNALLKRTGKTITLLKRLFKLNPDWKKNLVRERDFNKIRLKIEFRNFIRESLYKQRVDNSELNSQLIKAAQKNKYHDIKMLLEKGAYVDVKTPRMQRTPLIISAENKNRKAVKLLLNYGADINVKGIGGETPLFMALYSRDTKTAFLLIKHGAKVNAKTIDGTTMLMWSIWFRNYRIFKKILKTGPDLKSFNEYGETALSWAKSAGQSYVKLLMEYITK